MRTPSRVQPRAPLERGAFDAAHERFLTSGTVPESIRGLVAASWKRSAAAGVDADSTRAPIALARDELGDYRDAHPLSRVFPLLYDVLGRAAEECDSLMAVGDAHGRLLWVSGRRPLVSRAESIHFAEGTVWDEAHAGTNAPGTALQLDAPVQILGAEHFSRSVRGWSCAAAPIHDPVSQTVLGIVDVTGGPAVAEPQTMAMVRAAARMAEAELGRLVAVAGGRAPWSLVPHAPATPVFEALGRPDCQLAVGSRSLRLSPRHSEIAVLLVDHPEGLTGDQLAIELYADDVRGSTVRAELARLRSLLGPELLDSRPYRLTVAPECDWLTVAALLEAGKTAQAVRRYRGPLLPQSDAPGVVARRERLERQLRAAILASGETDLMMAWTRSRWGAEDLEMWRAQAETLSPASPLQPLAAAEVRRLDAELGF